MRNSLKKLWLQNKRLQGVFCFIVVSLLPLCQRGDAQVVNYVVNPSFENVTLTASNTVGHGVMGWTAIDSTKGAFLLRTVGPPFYNAPGPPGVYQYPRSGNNMIGYGFYCHHSTCPDSVRGYPRNRLEATLKTGKVYCARYHVNIRDASTVGIADFAILLAGTEIDTIKHCKKPLSYLSPQITYTGGFITDTLNWVAVNGTFVAQGHEKYMVLGNFKSNLATQTVAIQTSSNGAIFTDAYFDDVSLVEMELPAFAGRDTFLIPGDSVFLGREPDVGIDYACQWYKLPDATTPIDTIAGFWVKPTKTTSYLVRQQLWCSGVKWDTVTVFISGVEIKEFEVRSLRFGFTVFPNPANDNIIIELSGTEGHKVSTASFGVIDQFGRVVLQERIIFEDGFAMFDARELEEGLYFVELKCENGLVGRKHIFIVR